MVTLRGNGDKENESDEAKEIEENCGCTCNDGECTMIIGRIYLFKKNVN